MHGDGRRVGHGNVDGLAGRKVRVRGGRGGARPRMHESRRRRAGGVAVRVRQRSRRAGGGQRRDGQIFRAADGYQAAVEGKGARAVVREVARRVARAHRVREHKRVRVVARLVRGARAREPSEQFEVGQAGAFTRRSRGAGRGRCRDRHVCRELHRHLDGVAGAVRRAARREVWQVCARDDDAFVAAREEWWIDTGQAKVCRVSGIV